MNKFPTIPTRITSALQGLVCLSLLLVGTRTEAVTLLEYTFAGPSTSPTVLATGLASQNFNAGNGLKVSGNVYLVATQGNYCAQARVADANAASLSSAITNSDYFTFTVTPDTDYTINLDSFTFNAFISTDTGSNIPAKNYAVFSSLSSFTSGNELTSGTFTVTEPSPGIYPTPPQTISVPVNGSQFDGLTSSVEFRVYVWGGTGFGKATNLDNFTVDGTAAIPEPSAYWLLGAMSALIYVVRRRVKR